MTETTKATAAAAGFLDLGIYSVNRMGFGAMRITGPGIWGPPEDLEECKRVLRRAVELEVNFIDTADSYGPEVSENLIAEALYPYPEGLVVGTKAGLVRPAPGRWEPDGRPEHLREAVEGSLRRLRMERLRLLQFHRHDPKVPYEESIGALVEMQREGKIQHIGVSNVNVDKLTRAMSMAVIVSVQNRYNLTDRSSEPVLNMCEDNVIPFLPWFPVGAGSLAADQLLAELGLVYSATPAQVALAWLLHHSVMMLPIPGTSKVAHLEENVAAASIRLEPADLKALDAIAPPS
ncbi:MAG: aldo/keto reductase [Candidatus Dormiibacterota bacterium]